MTPQVSDHRPSANLGGMKHDFFTKAMVDTQVDRVMTVGETIEIESLSETAPEGPAKYPPWDATWRQKYLGHDSLTAAVPMKIQEPWAW
jgi:hypothetical protein